MNDTGDWVLLVALPVFVFVETGSGTATAVLFLCQLAAGAVLGPFGGALVDRFDLRRCLVATNLAQTCAVLPLLTVNEDRLWPAYLVMGAQSALTQINNPANVALVPRVVDATELTSANASLATAQSLARLIGAPVGGIIVAWGGLAPVVIFDGASFLLVAFGLSLLRADTSPLIGDGDPSPSVRDGVTIVAAHSPLAPLLALHSFGQIAQGAFSVLFVVFVVESLGDDGSKLGVIRGVMAIGGLAGAAIIKQIAHRVEATTLYSLGLIGLGAVSVIFWNAPLVSEALAVYLVLFALSGLPGAAISVGLFTTIQSVAPAQAIGRVTGLLGAGTTIGVAAGSIITGVLVDLVPLAWLLNAEAAIHIATGAIAYVLVRPDTAPAGVVATPTV